jgi:dTDP-4-dehydrorhamnose 3,5-epimerase
LIYWVPPGFAHGFLALEDDTVFTYKCTEVYNKDSEGSIRWDDPELGIEWGIIKPLMSEKDKSAPFFKDLDTKF